MTSFLDRYRKQCPRKPRGWNMRPYITQDIAQFIDEFEGMSIAGHGARAYLLSEFHHELKSIRDALIGDSQRDFGTDSALISGGFRDHWPNAVKNALRRLNRDMNACADGREAHARAATLLRKRK